MKHYNRIRRVVTEIYYVRYYVIRRLYIVRYHKKVYILLYTMRYNIMLDITIMRYIAIWVDILP